MKKIIKFFTISILLLTISSLNSAHSSVLAQGNEPVTTLGPITGVGPWQVTPSSIPEAGAAFAKAASAILGTLTIVAGLMLFLELVIGGISWITSGGDKVNTEKARNQITNAFIGIVIVVAAWAVIFLIGAILGLDILNPQNILPKLSPSYVAPQPGSKDSTTPGKPKKTIQPKFKID